LRKIKIFVSFFSQNANKKFSRKYENKKFSLQPYPALKPHDMMRLCNADCRNDDYQYRNADYCNADYRNDGLEPNSMQDWSRMTTGD
jgi:hypothetical protein